MQSLVVVILDFADGRRVVHVDLQPEQVEWFQHLRNPFAVLRLEVEVEVEIDVDIRPHRITERADEGLDVAQHLPAYDLVGRTGRSAEAAKVESGRFAREEDVGLERRIASADYFPSQRCHIIHTQNRRRPQDFAVIDPAGAAVRPVKTDPIARRSAEEFYHRNSQGLGLDVDQGEFDAGNRFGCNTARALAATADHVPKAHLIGSRVLPDEQRREILDGADHGAGIASIAALTKTSDAVVGFDFDKNPGPPTGVHNEGLDMADFHKSVTRIVHNKCMFTRVAAVAALLPALARVAIIKVEVGLPVQALVHQ